MTASSSCCLVELPDEILLQILCYLEPHNLPKLQLVCRKLRDVCLDGELWKRHCFERSSWYHFLQSRRRLITDFEPHETNATAHEAGDVLDQDIVTADEAESLLLTGEDERLQNHREKRLRFLQDMANWDPAFPAEHVSWYDEYIQRHGPTSVNWLEMPTTQVGGQETSLDVRGMGLYSPNNGNDGSGNAMVLSPLDDGSVCLWDVNGSRHKRGGIIAKSRPGILFADGRGNQHTSRTKKIDTGVTECVSVHQNGHRAFFAVQSHLLQVDLNRLEVVGRDSFEWSITTLSNVHDGVPLTVGTSLGIHLYDFRARAQVQPDRNELVDNLLDDNPFRTIFDPRPLPPYASLSQPTPISILHLPHHGDDNLVSDDIYVAGRFTNILHYDRRKFPRIVDSIYSGSRLSSLTSLPYPFSTLDHEIRRRGEFPADRVEQCKTSSNGRTIIAGGEYKTKGSLELYGLDAPAESSGSAVQQNSTMKNRYTAASSIILSVVNHGTKIVFSDGAGLIKWFERDGYTECRRLRIGHSDVQAASLFASMPGSDDLARKILSTKTTPGPSRPNEDNVLFWTGEKLGMVSFTGDPLFSAEDFKAVDTDKEAEEAERNEYANRMREALERQADDVRFVRGLGLGPVG